MDLASNNVSIATQKAQRKTYTKKSQQPQTLASINALIESKEHEIEAIQGEIEVLTTKRNELYFSESEGMGLINLVADPDKAAWLAKLIKEAGE